MIHKLHSLSRHRALSNPVSVSLPGLIDESVVFGSPAHSFAQSDTMQTEQSPAMQDPETRGPAISLLNGLPVIKKPAPPYGGKVTQPGGSGCVWLSDNGLTVLKAPLLCHREGCNEADKAMYEYEEKHAVRCVDREKEIYKHLGPHESILECLEITDAGIIFPYYKNVDLRRYLEKLKNDSTAISLSTKLKWIKSALTGLAFIHSKGVLQCDINARNFLVTDDGQSLILCDFAGSKLGDSDCEVLPEEGYAKVEGIELGDVSIATEVFAAGSLMYEIITGKKPYDGLEYNKVMSLFGRLEFPPTMDIVLGHTIQKCWSGGFESIQKVLDAVFLAEKTGANEETAQSA